jgi:hypothetical protein
MARVTRLGEFSPIGRFFNFGQSFENYWSSAYFWLLLSIYDTSYVLIWTKNWLGKLIWSCWNEGREGPRP